MDVQFLTSLGVYTVVANALALTFGHDAQPLTRLPNPAVLVWDHGPVPAVLSRVQAVTVVVSATVFAVMAAVLRWTSLGRATRACAANPDLTEALGIDRQRLLTRVAALGSLLAAIAAACVVADVGVTPDMGLGAVVTGAVAVVVGGVGSLSGAALGGLALGLLQHLARFSLPSRWEEAVTFAVLLAVLLLRPRGLLGRPALT